MRVVNQTASELVIRSFVDQKRLVFPGVLLGLALLGVGMAASAGALNIALVLVLGLLAALALSMLYGELKSETLTLDRTANQIRCDRQTPLGTQHWQLPLSALQDVSVDTFKRRHKKANGNRVTLWSYTIKFVAQDAPPQSLLYYRDGDGINVAYRAIREFWGAAAQDSPSSMHQPSGRGLGLVVTSVYERWRQATLAIQPEQVGGSSDEPDRVYGVLMDVGMLEEATAEPWAISMSAFLCGDASFFPTPGGGVVGLGGEPRVAEAARTIVRSAQTVLAQASPLQDAALPDQPDLVQFTLLTPGGVYGVADYLKRFQNPNEPLGQMLGQFGLIRQFAEQVLDKP
ncbi:MAG: hypothetical protein WBA57_20775 [Elainellaceae cyanobacterium]